MKRPNISDGLLLEHGGTVHKQLEVDLPDFTAFDNTLDAGMIKLKNCLDEAKGLDPDRKVKSGITEKTVTLAEVKEAAIAECNKVFYFAEKVFKSKPVILEEFGQNAFRKARTSQKNMALYLHQLAKTVGKYRAELTTAGAQPTLIDSIGDMAGILETSNLDQEVLKKMRPVLTVQRNAKLNELYAILKEFNKASKVIYAKKPEKLAKYMMPKQPRNTGKSTTEKQ